MVEDRGIVTPAAEDMLERIIEALKNANREYSIAAKEKRCSCCTDFEFDRKVERSNFADELLDMLDHPNDDRGYVRDAAA